MWVGWLWCRGEWHPQPSTRSSDLGSCSRKLGVLANAHGIPAVYQMMTGGGVPTIRPPERRAPLSEPDIEVEDP